MSDTEQTASPTPTVPPTPGEFRAEPRLAARPGYLAWRASVWLTAGIGLSAFCTPATGGLSWWCVAVPALVWHILLALQLHRRSVHTVWLLAVTTAPVLAFGWFLLVSAWPSFGTGQDTWDLCDAIVLSLGPPVLLATALAIPLAICLIVCLCHGWLSAQAEREFER